MEENIKTNLANWEKSFNQYIECERLCLLDINSMGEIKNNLKKLLGNQKKDDIVFYRSIIDNSHFYLTSSIKIRKSKFLKDLNNIWLKIDECKQMDELSKSTFMAMLKDYEKMADDINYARKNNTILRWVKDDNVESLQDVENEMTELMIYHLNLLSYFRKFVELEKNFYCGDTNEANRAIPNDTTENDRVLEKTSYKYIRRSYSTNTLS